MLFEIRVQVLIKQSDMLDTVPD